MRSEKPRLGLPTDNISEHFELIEKLASGCEKVLEIGAEFGCGSTLAIANGLRKCVWDEGSMAHVTVDIKDQIYPAIRPREIWWHMVVGDCLSLDTHAKVKSILCDLCQPEFFNLIYIDDLHEYDHLKKEIELYKSFSNERTVWLFHDTYMNGQRQHLLDAILEFAATSETHKYHEYSKTCHGLGALVPKAEGTESLWKI